jgi:hypothetical protein
MAMLFGTTMLWAGRSEGWSGGTPVSDSVMGGAGPTSRFLLGMPLSGWSAQFTGVDHRRRQ